MPRINTRSLSVRQAGNPANLGAVASITLTPSGTVSSVTIATTSPGANVLLTADTLFQLRSQGAIGVITARTANTVTISFYVQPAQTNSSPALLQTSTSTPNGSPTISTGTLTSKSVTISNGTFQTSLIEAEAYNFERLI